MMSTAISVILGIVFLIIVVIVDLKVLKWIVDGGLKTKNRRLLIVQLPATLCFLLWVFAYIVPYFLQIEGTDFDFFAWAGRLTFVLSSFYGLGFFLYNFTSSSSETDFNIYSLLFLGMAIFALADITGLRFNTTASMPKGIYVMEPVAEQEQPTRGDFVTFCLEPDNPYTSLAATRGYIGPGTCRSGLKPLLKRLAGLPGDMVEVSPDGIILDGLFLSKTARPEYDSLDRLMPPSLLEDGPIPEGMALVLSQQMTNSFDSRHFGLVPYDSLTKVTPVLTNKKEGSYGAATVKN